MRQEISDLLDVRGLRQHSEVSDIIKASLRVQCPTRGCSDRSMNYVCYIGYENCPFYQAYLRQLEDRQALAEVPFARAHKKRYQ